MLFAIVRDAGGEQSSIEELLLGIQWHQNLHILSHNTGSKEVCRRGNWRRRRASRVPMFITWKRECAAIPRHVWPGILCGLYNCMAKMYASLPRHIRS